MPDSLFRQRLRRMYFDLQDKLGEMEHGSAAWHDCEKAMFRVGRLYVTLYGEAVVGVHSAGEMRKPATGLG